MTNAPETRKTHVVRLVGTNKDKDVLQGIWVDVERIDQFTITTQTGEPVANQWQEITVRLKWRDDPTKADGYIPETDLDADADTGRVHEIVKVCSPDEADLENPVQWVPIKTIRHIDMQDSDLGMQKRFVAQTVEAAGREIQNRRIYHYGASIDDAAKAAFDADKTLKAYVAVGHDNTGQSEGYQRDDSTKDQSQYVEHEVIMGVSRNDTDSSYSTGGIFQETQFKLKNQYLIDESVPAQLDKVGALGFNPPYRLDPFQNIINVKFSQDVIVVFVDIDNTHKSTFEILSTPSGTEKAKLLDQNDMSIGFSNPAYTTAYKVPVGAGEFVTVTAAGSGDGSYTQVGGIFYVLVFAIEGKIEDSLSRAKDGTYSLLAAHAFGPGVVATAPPGLLWSAGSHHMPAGKVINWKIRYDNHRDDKNSKNKMVQCYPISTSWTMSPIPVTYSGYLVFLYRLDSNGTGDNYGTTDVYSTPDLVSVDPAWHQQIASAGNNDSINYGIPFGDPPPLIANDVVSFPYPDSL